MGQLTTRVENLWELLGGIMVAWGEKTPKRGEDPDPGQKFLGYFTNFTSSYQRARQVLARKRELKEKRRRQEEERKKRAAKRQAGKARAGAGEVKKSDDEDIFGNYNRTLKTGNAEDILNEFKNRQ